MKNWLKLASMVSLLVYKAIAHLWLSVYLPKTTNTNRKEIVQSFTQAAGAT